MNQLEKIIEQQTELGNCIYAESHLNNDNVIVKGCVFEFDKTYYYDHRAVVLDKETFMRHWDSKIRNLRYKANHGFIVGETCRSLNKECIGVDEMCFFNITHVVSDLYIEKNEYGNECLMCRLVFLANTDYQKRNIQDIKKYLSNPLLSEESYYIVPRIEFHYKNDSNGKLFLNDWNLISVDVEGVLCEVDEKPENYYEMRYVKGNLD